MKEHNNIDKLFKSGISGYNIDPSEQVWQNVETGFFGKKGFLFYKWYYLSAALILLILTSGGIWYYGVDSNNWGSSSNEDFIQFTRDIHSTRIDHQPLDNSQKDYIDINTKNNLNDKTESLESTPGEIIIDETINTNESKASESNINNNYNKPVIAKQNLYNSSNSKRYAVETEKKESNNYVESHTGNILSINARTINIGSFYKANMIDPEKVTGMQKYLEKQSKSHFYTGASFNAGMVYYPSTKDQFTWSADLAFGITASKFYFETGVGYQDVKERGIYTIDLKSYDSVGYYNEVESFEIDPQNPDEIIYNTNKVSVYDSIDHYTHTTPLFKYKYVNIPISIGYKFFQKQNFSVSVNTGLLLSLLVEKDIPDAEYYNPDYTTVRIQNQTPERVDWNLQWKIAVRFNYNLYKTLSVSAEPVFTKYINSIYNTDLGYPDVKPYTMGLRVGIYYGF